MENESVNIKFVGKHNTVKNVVDKVTFEKIYKPKGWVIDTNNSTSPIEIKDFQVKTTDETVIKNIEQKKKIEKTNNNFDDKIIKEN